MNNLFVPLRSSVTNTTIHLVSWLEMPSVFLGAEMPSALLGAVTNTVNQAKILFQYQEFPPLHSTAQLFKLIFCFYPINDENKVWRFMQEAVNPATSLKINHQNIFIGFGGGPSPRLLPKWGALMSRKNTCTFGHVIEVGNGGLMPPRPRGACFLRVGGRPEWMTRRYNL
jgi:hypothetical protein